MIFFFLLVSALVNAMVRGHQAAIQPLSVAETGLLSSHTRAVNVIANMMARHALSPETVEYIPGRMSFQRK